MNKFILNQLKKIRFANLPDYNDDTTEIFIPKQTNEVSLEEGKCYIIEVENYIIKPYEGFTLHDNWNKGIVPKHKFMKCEVCQIMGKMIRIDAIGYDWENKEDILDSWSGWLPIKSVKIIKEV